MSAPKGNKFAKGHGRPPNPGYSDSDLIQLGEDFMAWIQLMDSTNTEIVHLSEWYSQVKKIPRSQWDSIVRRDSFLVYYERALDWMGTRILKNKNLSPTYGSRFLGIYFPSVANHETEQAKKKIDYEFDKRTEYDKKYSTPPNDDELNIKLDLIRKEGEIHNLKKELISLKESLAKR